MQIAKPPARTSVNAFSSSANSETSGRVKIISINNNPNTSNVTPTSSPEFIQVNSMENDNNHVNANAIQTSPTDADVENHINVNKSSAARRVAPPRPPSRTFPTNVLVDKGVLPVQNKVINETNCGTFVSKDIPKDIDELLSEFGGENFDDKELQEYLQEDLNDVDIDKLLTF